VTYTPTTDYTGSDSFTFKAHDGQADSNIATVSVTVTASANTAPVAQAQNVSTLKNAAKPVVLVAADADGDALTYSIMVQPAHGSLSAVTGADVTYTPATDYVGSDTFTFKATDGQADSNAATVSITVTAPPNTAPVAQDQSVSTVKNTVKTITFAATDADGDTLTYSIVTQPANGAIGGTPPNVTYTPAAGYTGADSFTFKANDGKADSNVASVSVTVTAPATVLAPSVVGMARTSAETAIVSAGLVVGSVSEAYSDTVASGIVISQNPAAGTSVVPGTTVALEVSKGKKPKSGCFGGTMDSGKLSGPGPGARGDVLLLGTACVFLFFASRRKGVLTRRMAKV
jgi:hypothetical protein